MKNKLIFAFSFLFLLSGFIPLQSQTSLTLTKDIVVAEGEVQENVISFGGNILIEGKVKESVIAFGGTITVKGEVGEVVLGIGSTIILKSTAVIGGDVASLGGELTKEPGCTIDGDTIYFKTSEDVSFFAFYLCPRSSGPKSSADPCERVSGGRLRLHLELFRFASRG